MGVGRSQDTSANETRGAAFRSDETCTWAFSFSSGVRFSVEAEGRDGGAKLTRRSDKAESIAEALRGPRGQAATRQCSWET